MKKLVVLLSIAMVLAVLCACTVGDEADTSQIDNIESSLIDLLSAAGNKNIVVYDSSELTAEILENRVVQRLWNAVLALLQTPNRVTA